MSFTRAARRHFLQINFKNSFKFNNLTSIAKEGSRRAAAFPFLRHISLGRTEGAREPSSRRRTRKYIKNK
jgi:hypothetical protein